MLDRARAGSKAPRAVRGRRLGAWALWAAVAASAACASDPTSVDPTPAPGPTPNLIALDLLADDYFGLSGGLVDNGRPTVTATDGRVVIIAISMSNGRLEFDRFIERYAHHPDVSAAIGLVNCARGGNALERWLERQELWDDCRSKVVSAGFAPEQIKVVWAKDADQFTDHGRTLPDPRADYYDMVANISALSERIGREFPSVQAVFHSSRIYAGYVAQARQAARGEPISYEGGLAVNAAIERWKAGELPDAPWIGWGPYLWANATTPNGSGLTWLPEDFRDGGLDPHPSDAGQTKVADALHAFFMQFDWYRR